MARLLSRAPGNLHLGALEPPVEGDLFRPTGEHAAVRGHDADRRLQRWHVTRTTP